MVTVYVKPDGVAQQIREYIRDHPDIRKDEYANPDAALHGSCYVAAEAYWHADGAEDSDLDVCCLSWSDIDPSYEGTHWFLRNGDDIVDLSLPTPSDGDDVPWDAARTRVFITGYEASQRAQTILEAINT